MRRPPRGFTSYAAYALWHAAVFASMNLLYWPAVIPGLAGTVPPAAGVLVAAIGIALTRHVSGFALVAAPFIALFVGLLWFPLDLAAACFCVDNRRESCGEWPAAFWLTAEALFVIGVCTALPMA